MSSMPREALKTSASKPGVIGVASSSLNALARAITSCGSEMSAGGGLFFPPAGAQPRTPSRLALGAAFEVLEAAFGVGGNVREVGAVEVRALQRPCFKQRLFRLFARGII